MRPEIVKMNGQAPEASLVTYAAEKIRAGEVLGVPTDTFYGLAVDPFNLHAVDRVYEIKTRSRHKPLSLLIESVDQAADMAGLVPEIFYLLARRFWPGPLTIIVKADPKLPLKVTANTGNVALRVPAAEIPLAIIRSAGLPITATSANLHGEVECSTAMQVRDQLGDCLSIIVDGGQVPGVMPSTIIDLTGDGSWRLLRQGCDSRGTNRRAPGPGVDRHDRAELQISPHLLDCGTGCDTGDGVSAFYQHENHARSWS